jgi:hypothetical protein
MKQVVLFNYQITIKGFNFQAKKMYIFEMGGTLPAKWVYYKGTYLGLLNVFQNQYIETNFITWIDDKETLAALAA